MGSGRLSEMLDAVRQEFEGITHDNSALKLQREEFEAKGAFYLYDNMFSVMGPGITPVGYLFPFPFRAF